MGVTYSTVLDVMESEFVRVQGVDSLAEAGRGITFAQLCEVRLPEQFRLRLNHLAVLYAMDANNDGWFSYDDILGFAQWLATTFPPSSTSGGEELAKRVQARCLIRLWKDTVELGNGHFALWFLRLLEKANPDDVLNPHVDVAPSGPSHSEGSGPQGSEAVAKAQQALRSLELFHESSSSSSTDVDLNDDSSLPDDDPPEADPLNSTRQREAQGRAAVDPASHSVTSNERTLSPGTSPRAVAVLKAFAQGSIDGPLPLRPDASGGDHSLASSKDTRGSGRRGGAGLREQSTLPPDMPAPTPTATPAQASPVDPAHVADSAPPGFVPDDKTPAPTPPPDTALDRGGSHTVSVVAATAGSRTTTTVGLSSGTAPRSFTGIEKTESSATMVGVTPRTGEKQYGLRCVETMYDVLQVAQVYGLSVDEFYATLCGDVDLGATVDPQSTPEQKVSQHAMKAFLVAFAERLWATLEMLGLGVLVGQATAQRSSVARVGTFVSP